MGVFVKMTGELWAALILGAIGVYLITKAEKAKAATSDPTAEAPPIFNGTGESVGTNNWNG